MMFCGFFASKNNTNRYYAVNIYAALPEQPISVYGAERKNYMLRKITISTREAREAGITDKSYLCGERVAAAFGLTANGVSYYTSYPVVRRLGQPYSARKRSRLRQALFVGRTNSPKFFKTHTVSYSTHILNI